MKGSTDWQEHTHTSVRLDGSSFKVEITCKTMLDTHAPLAADSLKRGPGLLIACT